MPRQPRQLFLDLTRRRPDDRRGGKREHAGRKPYGAHAPLAHAARPPLDGRTPVHVTMRLLPGTPRLRRRDVYLTVRRSLARAAHRPDFAITDFSVQGNHLHLITEPADARALGNGIKSFGAS